MVLLDCIVGEMDESIVEVLHVEFFGGCADVAVLVPIAFLIPVDAGDANIRSDIKFSFLVEEGHDVLLNDMSARATHFVNPISADDLFDLLQTFHDLNTCASVRVLSRFDQPRISFFRLKTVFKLLILLFLLLLLNTFCPPLILLLKFFELLV